MRTDLWSRVEPLLAGVERPARYIDGEWGASHTDDADYNAVLIYPDTYEIGLPNQGLQILYEILNERPDAAAERIRTLIFNSLVRKNEKFEYVGELANEIKTSDDGKTVTFILRDGVKFHNGRVFSSVDVKYTFDKLFESKGFKSGAFFDTVPVGPAPANTNSAPVADVKKPAPGETLVVKPKVPMKTTCLTRPDPA